MYTLSGIVASSGIAVAKSLIIASNKGQNQHEDLFAYDVDLERDRYIKKTLLFSTKLLQIGNPAKDSLRDLIGAAAGFLNSADNKKEILDLINSGCSASIAAKTVLLENLDSFIHKNNDLKADREELTNLMNEFVHTLEHSSTDAVSLPNLTHDVILITKNLTPAQLLSMDTKFIKGLILEGGRDSSHLSVVLRELNIPSLFAVFDATTIKNDIEILIDGNSGLAVVEPSEEIKESLLSRQDPFSDQINDESLLNITVSCAVGAINQSQEKNITQYAQHGLGLLRSEFLFLSSKTEPSEDEMTQTFYKIFTKIKLNAPITARTFDFADDKKPLFNVHLDESGPLQGYGGCVGTELLKKEIRALLRASQGRKITIVFPLITRISEKDYLISLAKECVKELDLMNTPHGTMAISFMIETPAAVLLAPEIAKEGDMMIIGTSSLAEYASAPCPPDSAFTPVLAKMIVMAAKAAFEANATLGIAGRFASRTELLPLFYRLGVTYLVAGSYNINKLKAVIERINLEKELKPSFNEELYCKIMSIYKGSELACLINTLN